MAMLSVQTGPRRHLSWEMVSSIKTPVIFLKGFQIRIPENAQTNLLADKFEQKPTSMTRMGQVIQFSRKDVTVGSGHSGGSFDAMARLLQRKKGLKKWL